MCACQSQRGRRCRQMVGWRDVKWDWGLCQKPVALDGLETRRVFLKLHSDRAKFIAPSQVGYVTKYSMKDFSKLCISDFADISFQRRLPPGCVFPLVPLPVPPSPAPPALLEESPSSENIVGMKFARKM